MSRVFVAVGHELDHGKPMPRFHILTELPEHTRKVYELQPGECLDAAQVFMGDDLTYVRVELYRVSNLEGQAKSELIENFTMSYIR